MLKKTTNNDKLTPKVSIIIPVFNGENYLEIAINSAINQDYSNIEIIVVNDGSSDQTEIIAKSYEPKIKYFHQNNQGVASALNLGINKMTGIFFSWLSHDDYYEGNKISTQITYLLENNLNFDSTILYSNFYSVNKFNQIVNKSDIENINNDFTAWLITKRDMHGCSLLIPKTAFETIGYFDKSLRYVQDYMLWLEFSYSLKFVFMKDYLIFSRQHAEQDSKKYLFKQRKETSKLITVYIDHLSSSQRITHFFAIINMIIKNSFTYYLIKYMYNMVKK